MVMRLQRGFTLIELMIVVAIVGILVAVALPAFQDYSTRAKVTEVIGFNAAYKNTVADCLFASGGNTAACDSNTELGLSSSVNSNLVNSITLSAGSVAGTVLISTVFQGTGSALDGETLGFLGSYSTQGITWACGVDQTALYRFIPQNCRNSSASF